MLEITHVRCSIKALLVRISPTFSQEGTWNAIKSLFSHDFSWDWVCDGVYKDDFHQADEAFENTNKQSRHLTGMDY